MVLGVHVMTTLLKMTCEAMMMTTMMAKVMMRMRIGVLEMTTMQRMMWTTMMMTMMMRTRMPRVVPQRLERR